MTISRVSTVGNGQIKYNHEWDLMDKINILGSLEKSIRLIHTHGSAPKRSAKFGRQKQTFCGKKAKNKKKSSQTGYK